MKIRILLTAVMMLALTAMPSVFAQKFGHVNSAQLIESHPKVATANTELENFRKSVMDPFEQKAKAFEAKYTFFIEEVNAGTLSKVTAQIRQEELQKELDSLRTEQQQLEFTIMQKREALLQPILTEIDSIIQVIGKEKQYTMIFDTSVSGALLFAQESNDLTEEVKGRIKG